MENNESQTSVQLERRRIKEMFTKQSKLEKGVAALNLVACFGAGIFHGYNTSKGVETGIENIPSDIAICAGVIQGATHLLTSFNQGKYDRGLLVPLVYMPAVSMTGILLGEFTGRLAHYAGI